jgi:hypothetical protein
MLGLGKMLEPIKNKKWVEACCLDLDMLGIKCTLDSKHVGLKARTQAQEDAFPASLLGSTPNQALGARLSPRVVGCMSNS